ncbi:MAG TPA: hypothetical protein VIF62_04775 [Labilithrix sp.]
MLASIVAVGVALAIGACSHDPPPTPVVPAPTPRTAEAVTPTRLVTSTAYRARLPEHGGELYIPSWFSPAKGGYDLLVHFHGLGKLQEANIEKAQLNVAVVSFNLGMGTPPYENAFKDPTVFQKLLADVQVEIDNSGRGRGAPLRRLALSAWSAGFVSVAQVMKDPQVESRVDAVLLADGFFTSFLNVQKRTMNTAPLQRFVHLAEAAEKNDKLFAITHSSIPTGDYPSVQECVTKLLELTSCDKVPNATVGPRNMKEIYAVDRGSFHVRGFEGQAARDHIDQIRAMGETLFPLLKERWDQQDAAPPPPATASK